MKRKHAILSASGAYRWLNCPPSARLEAELPDEVSEYAAEGTTAHKMAEEWLRDWIDNGYLLEHEGEMADYVQRYIDIVLEKIKPDSEVFLEQRLDFSPWVPEGFGTGDAVIITDDVLEIVDLKYGKGVPVSAENNPQLRLYALGAVNEFSVLFDFERIRTTIVQPRLDSVTSEELTLDELLEWGEQIKPIAQQAYEGKGEFKAGDHCRFCKARRTCRARAEANLELARYEFRQPELLTVEEVAEILAKAEELAAWAKDVKEYALTQAYRHGVKFPGWKVVEGRSTRKITDEAELAKRLAAEGYDPFKQVLKTITELEKTVGKKKFAELSAGLVEKPPGKPTLVPESDERPEISSAALDFKEEI